VRQAALTCARVALLAGPAVLAFFSGGYFDGPRVWAGLIVWLLVAVAALTAGRPLPRSRSAWLAIGGLAALAGWTLLSFTWAPLAGTAYHDGQRVFLYLGTLVAATALLRGHGSRLVEPAVAASATVVVTYGISERLLPWLLTFQHSTSARGRLEQPLTYWNAMGAVAAIGVVLCAHLAGDERRPAPIRVAAAAAAAPLGMGLYCSFSRGALFAGAAGLVALLVLAPGRTGWRAIALVVAAVILGSLCAAPFGGVASLEGSHHTRVVQGTVALVLLAAVTLVATLVQLSLIRREAAGRLGSGPIRLPRHAGWVALGVVLAAFVVFLAVGAKEKSAGKLSANASRLTSLQSNRYDYWRVAWRAFKAEPIRGVGGGGWAVYWLRYRPFRAGAQDAHSLYIQTAAELGVIGLALLAAFLAGVVLAARRALRAAPNLAAGLTAGVVVWAAHCAVDWDWEMPAVTLLAILLMGGLLALGEALPARPAADAGP
jgi:O-Antigen ligase